MTGAAGRLRGVGAGRSADRALRGTGPAPVAPFLGQRIRASHPCAPTATGRTRGRTAPGTDPLDARSEPAAVPAVAVPQSREDDMGKGILLWLIGVPIPVIIVLYLLFFR